MFSTKRIVEIDRVPYTWSQHRNNCTVSTIIFGHSSCGLINLQLDKDDTVYATMAGKIEKNAILTIDQKLAKEDKNLQIIFISACTFNLHIP